MGIRDLLFPKPNLVPIEVNEDGWMVFFNGARRHKIMKQEDGEVIFQCWYSCKDPFTTAGRETPCFPILHWHRNQDEHVKVLQGRVGYVKDGVVGYGVAGDEVDLPRGVVHTFWVDGSYGEDAMMEFSGVPGEGIDAVWLNNFYGVMDSLYREGKTLGFMHAIVFCLDAQSAPGNLPKWLGILVTYIMGHIALWAGYSANYPMYAKYKFD